MQQSAVNRPFRNISTLHTSSPLPLLAQTPAVIRFLEKIFHAWTHTVSSSRAEEQCTFVLFGFFSFFPPCGTFSCCFFTTQSSRGNVTRNTIMSLLMGVAALLAGVSRGPFALSPRWRKISLQSQFYGQKSFLGSTMLSCCFKSNQQKVVPHNFGQIRSSFNRGYNTWKR